MAGLLRWPAGLALSTVLACQAVPPGVNPPMLTVVNEDNGGSLTLGPGQALRIVLRESATAGYRWELEHADPALIELVSTEANYADPAVGSGGNAAFVFRSRQPGEGKLVLKHRRRWEGESSTVSRFCLGIKVEARE